MLQAFIISWKGKHQSAEKIYREIQDHCNEVTIIYSDPNEFFSFDEDIRSIRRPNNLMFGDKMDACLKNFSGDIFLLIHADCFFDDWRKLISRCQYVFDNFPDVTLWSPIIENSWPLLEAAEMRQIHGSGLSVVASTDAIILGMNGEAVRRLNKCDYKQNVHGWAAHVPALVAGYARGKIAVMDRFIKVYHDPSRGYSSEVADREGREFLNSMSTEERALWKNIENYLRIADYLANHCAAKK
jgi:hypothetical protein